MKEINKKLVLIYMVSAFMTLLVSVSLVSTVYIYWDHLYLFVRVILLLSIISMLIGLSLICIVLYALILLRRYEIYNEKQKRSAIRDYYRYIELINPSDIDT